MRVAVLGAGPIGLEVATHAAREGHDVVVYEAGARVGACVLGWGHLKLFTPWRMNTTELGRSIVATPQLAGDDCPTGAEYVRDYLAPLARWLDVRTGHRIKAVGRPHLGKGDAIGSPARLEDGFRLLIEGPMGETVATADRVVDCTGLGEAGPAGSGGLPVPGESMLAKSGHIVYGPLPVQGLEGRRVLLVGDGASASSVVRDLLSLQPRPRITWITLAQDGPGFASPEDDPLPERRELFEVARAATRKVEHLPGASIERFLTLEDGSVGVRLADRGEIAVDRVLVCTGYRPDTRLTRELQVHLCYATEGTMKLAAALLDGSSADCLTPKASGPELLANPEPGFWVLGSRSYGRRSDFLLQNGHAQVLELMGLLRSSP
jgi:thioredoxin reductase